MAMNKLLALALLIALGGCGTLSTTAPPVAAPASEVTRTAEQDGRFIAFVGPRRQHAEPFLGVPSTNFYALRSWVDSYAGAERKWNAARDGEGRELRFVEISRNEITCEGGCSYAEEFAAALPEALLRASPDGLAVNFTTASGLQKLIAVSGELIQKQLAAVDAARAGRPTATADAMESRS